MSFEEKRVWIYVCAVITTYLGYVFVVLGRAGDGSVTDVAYATPLIASIVVSILITIIASIIVAIVTGDSGKVDERDRSINRYGEYIGHVVMGVVTLGPLILAMAEAKHFWIANAIYLGYGVSAITTSAVKLVAYRRGF